MFILILAYSAQQVFGMKDSGYIFSMGIWWRCDGYTVDDMGSPNSWDWWASSGTSPDHPICAARRSQAKPRALALPFGGMATRSTCHVIFFWRRLKLECGCNHFSEWRIRSFSWLQVLLTTWICESTLLLQLWLLLSSCCIWIPHKSTCSEARREENHWKPLVKNPPERRLANVLWINLIKLSDSETCCEFAFLWLILDQLSLAAAQNQWNMLWRQESLDVLLVEMYARHHLYIIYCHKKGV
jgi:hypothetical protein